MQCKFSKDPFIQTSNHKGMTDAIDYSFILFILGGIIL